MELEAPQPVGGETKASATSRHARPGTRCVPGRRPAGRGARSELTTAFVMLKRAEWDRYVANVPDPGSTDITEWSCGTTRPSSEEDRPACKLTLT